MFEYRGILWYLPFLVVSGGVLGGVTKVKDVCDDDSEAPPGIELLRAGENDCLVPTPMATGEPVLGEPLRGEPTAKDEPCHEKTNVLVSDLV